MSTKTVTTFQTPVVYDVDSAPLAAIGASAPGTMTQEMRASFGPAVPAAIATIVAALVGAAVTAAVAVQRRRRRDSVAARVHAGYVMVAVSGARIGAQTALIAN
ncbi:hypothetical protein AMAG_17743 [Allomyces macrogynus ATCC 38327]|uniref:Uncharacterized protein n=1 Tax=Allomyces macrogynus (strain ATCC 38327) TaxID=578462 RepID=A0A0L0RYA7_ALLM3|nr:hypothetical protein AMAG_17743 [Allomyces macrogynus ATCC 38327]|eukprot:KNE55135.1 hypothetical protein AMAG_17743 [Allomyces macrogynus ATCC 38327]